MDAMISRVRGSDFVPDSDFRNIEMLDYPRRLVSMRRGDMIVGYLFEHSLETYVEGQLAGAMPISGPIFWVELVGEHYKFQAQCAGCSEGSKPFWERDGKILRWAYDHRCKSRNELKGVMR